MYIILFQDSRLGEDKMNDKELISLEEAKALGDVILSLIKECPFKPQDISVRYGTLEDNCIGIFTASGSIVLKKYVSGTYKAQYQCFIRLRTKPTTSADTLEKENLLDQIAIWLCGKEVNYKGNTYTLDDYPTLTDKRKIDELNQMQTTHIVSKEEDGSTEFQTMIQIKYIKKG